MRPFLMPKLSLMMLAVVKEAIGGTEVVADYFYLSFTFLAQAHPSSAGEVRMADSE